MEKEKTKEKGILRALLDPALPDPVPWSSSELCAILKHQLATRLDAEKERFETLSAFRSEEVRTAMLRYGHLTFAEVLLARGIPEIVIELVKDFAKASLQNHHDLPDDVARVIYLLAILQGQAAGMREISSLGKGTLLREIRRCLTYGWLPPETAQRFVDLSTNA